MIEVLVMDHTKRKYILKKKSLFRCPKCNKIGERQLSNNKKYVQYLHKKYDTGRIKSCILKIHQERHYKE